MSKNEETETELEELSAPVEEPVEETKPKARKTAPKAPKTTTLRAVEGTYIYEGVAYAPGQTFEVPTDEAEDILQMFADRGSRSVQRA